MSSENSATEPVIDPKLVAYLRSIGQTPEQYANFLAAEQLAAEAEDKAKLEALEATGTAMINQLNADEDLKDFVLRGISAQQTRATRATRPAKPTAGATRTLNCAGTNCPQPNRQWEAPVQQGRVPILCPVCKAAAATGKPAKATKAGRPPKMRAIDPHDFGQQGEPKNIAQAKFRLKHEKNPTHLAALQAWVTNQRSPVGRTTTVRHPASKVGQSFRTPTEAPKAAAQY